MPDTPLSTAPQIFQTLVQHQPKLRRMGVRRIGLFGSYGRGESRPDSDMDFLVELENPTFDRYMDLKFFLEDLFGCDIDLVLEETLKPRLRPHILAEVQYAPGY